MSASLQKSSGLTLLEVLVLLLIVVGMAAAILPTVLERIDDARAGVARDDLNELRHALERFKLDNHFYPSTEQGLKALVAPPATAPQPRNWNADGYLKKRRVPLDPWGNAYRYVANDGLLGFELHSLGADGEPGGSGYDADIHYSQP